TYIFMKVIIYYIFITRRRYNSVYRSGISRWEILDLATALLAHVLGGETCDSVICDLDFGCFGSKSHTFFCADVRVFVSLSVHLYKVYTDPTRFRILINNIPTSKRS
ncbi:hypothetical protein ACJX0J_032544, partial [Zea mays]